MDSTASNSGRELIHEAGMKAIAVERHQKKVAEAKQKGRESATEPWRGAVAMMVDAAAEHLEKELKRRGRAAVGVLRLRETKLKPDALAFIAARTVIDGIAQGHRVQTITQRVGTRIEDEVRMKEFKRREPNLWKWMQKRFTERGSTDYAHQRAVLMAAMRRANSEEEWKPWSIKDKAHVGLQVLDALMQSGFLAKHVQGARGQQTHAFVVLTPEAEHALNDRDTMVQELLKPWFKPMLHTPVDWTTPNDGGYVTVDLPIMKTRNRQDIERLRAAEMPVVYEALNAIQRTPWQINQDVLVVAEELTRLDYAVAGLPGSAEAASPVRPALPPIGEELSEEERATLKTYKKARAAFFSAEARRRSHTTQVRQILAVGDELRHEPAIYFPHQLDYRGRMYAIPLQLNPQGSDLARGVLRFAEGRPLGEMGAFWLAVHGANCYGEDKVALNARADWTCDHEAEIRAVAADPFTHTFWHDADCPFQFLAFCFEWAAYLDSGEDPDFVSHLHVDLDGSCNGLQHFSAMLRDAVGAEATNLTPRDEPGDIYQQVASAVAERVAVAASEERIALQWHQYGIDRGLVKRQVMTTPYGATAEGMKRQLLDEVKHRGHEDQFEDPWEAGIWLAPIIYEAIGSVVMAAGGAMGFLQSLAKVTARQDLPLSWTSPSGFPVVQYLNKQTQFTIQTRLLGRIQLRYRQDLAELDRRRQASSIAPNFVHSYDAAHLALTVVRAEREAGRPLSWAVVHDSFGCHAGDVELMRDAIREEFVGMYWGRQPLVDLADQVALSVPSGTELPALPAEGSFELEQVLGAEFFFA